MFKYVPDELPRSVLNGLNTTFGLGRIPKKIRFLTASLARYDLIVRKTKSFGMFSSGTGVYSGLLITKTHRCG